MSALRSVVLVIAVQIPVECTEAQIAEGVREMFRDQLDSWVVTAVRMEVSDGPTEMGAESP